MIEEKTRQGDLWILGRHRLLCGNCADPRSRDLVFGGATMELILTDPPYCSGGFQEAQRGSGSIGTDARAQPKILNDALSTRGYMALMRESMSGFPVVAALVFTDWRMWVNLFDVMESNSYLVKNMIVWDKQSIGMGAGFRPQHELIMYALRGQLVLDGHKSQSNVISCKRTGNKFHPTQKPVELLEKLLGVVDLTNVYDPFTGSGSTLIACENTGRNFFGCELDPVFVDTAVRRWRQATLETPIRIPAGEEAPPACEQAMAIEDSGRFSVEDKQAVLF